MIGRFFFLMILPLMFTSDLYAALKIVNFSVHYKNVHFTGKDRTALAINNQIPAPTLHFKQGDQVIINVTNHLKEETAIHWHGMLVPWQMDGVLGISQKGIPPGKTFQYKFTLEQSGSYWYHAHAGLQEQQGIYGAFIIDPIQPSPFKYSKDYVLVLSDWINTNPNRVYANLKKTGDYYSPSFPLQPSLMHFIHDYKKASTEERKKIIDDYKMMQHMRMSIYDFSDVAYDAFLLNGQDKTHPWTGLVKKGDVVRLRFIGAGGSTIFHVKIPEASIEIIQVDGNYVKPYFVHDFTVAPGETFDVLIKIKENKPYIIYAESADTLGAAYGALITSPNQLVNYQDAAPFPTPLPVSRDMMSGMGHSMKMDHSMMNMNATNIQTTGTKYQNLTGLAATNDPDKPIEKIIRMDLNGYMERFIWFINGVPEYNAKPIPLKAGKRYRIIFTNNSMMHHPMHIHGHWFIVRNGHGAHDPLLHTIDVPPNATVTADMDTDASGQWFFHCHMIYHMLAGMSRVFQYSSLIEIVNGQAKPQHIIKQTQFINRPIVRADEVSPIDKQLVHHPMAHPMGVFAANFIDFGADPTQNFQKLTFKGLYGKDYDKLELYTNDAEFDKGTVENADMDVFYWHLIDQFWAVKGGVNYFYKPTTKPYWQLGMGIEGLMPYFIETNLRTYYYKGSAKLNLELDRDIQITNHLFFKAGIRSILATKTIAQAAIGNGLNQMQYTLTPYYRLMPGLSVFFEYEKEQDYGSFRKLQILAGDSAQQNTYTIGLSVII